jgi:hypothetical protein
MALTYASSVRVSPIKLLVLIDDELDGERGVRDPLPDTEYSLAEYSESPKESEEGVADLFDLLCFLSPAMVLGGRGFLK